MNPGALPPALSDLFLPEPPAGGERVGQSGQTPAPAPSGDVDRFERFLSSARATPDDRPSPDRDDRRSAVDRPGRPRRPASDRADRADDRAAGSRSGSDPVGDRGPKDVTDRNGDRIDGGDRDAEKATGRASETETGTETETDGADGAENDAANEVETGSGETESAAGSTDSGSTSAGSATSGSSDRVGERSPSAEPIASVDEDTEVGEVDLDQPRLGRSEEVGPSPGSDGDPVAGLAGTETDGAAADAGRDEVDAPLVMAAAATTVVPTRATEPETGAEPAAPGEVTTTELDGSIALDEGPPAADGVAPRVEGTTATDRESDLLAEGQDAGGDDAGTGSGPDRDAGTTGGEQPPGPESAPTDEPDSAPVASRASTIPRSTVTTDPTVAGVDAVVGTSRPTNRTTVSGSAPGAADQVRLPPADGGSGDPLWLQVRRAMGSLRTLQGGEQQMTIRLRPAELGSVMVRVQAGEQGTTVSLVADSAVAANQLSQQRQQLVAELEQGGLAGVAVDVASGNETDLRDGTSSDEDGPASGPDAEGAAAAPDRPGANRAGGRGRRPAGASGSLVDVDL